MAGMEPSSFERGGSHLINSSRDIKESKNPANAYTVQ
jgi:hypothetical protein